MSDDKEEHKPVVRNTDLIKDRANGHEAGQHDDHDLSFRQVRGLKSSVGLGAEGRFQHIIPDHSADTLFDEVVRLIDGMYQSVRVGRGFRVEPIFGLAQSVVDYATPDRLIKQVFQEEKHSFYPYLNAAHSTAIATEVARGLGYGHENLVRLAAAALVHDVGSQMLPRELLEKRGRLTQEEFAKVQTHPDLGAQVLTAHAPRHPWLAQIVRQEHEREDGQGYPQGLLSENIHEEAKIIGVADIYDALITPRPYRKAMCPHEAIKELLSCQERMGYSRTVVRALIQQLSLFPPGCWVKLSSNEIGRVLQTNSRAPLRPVVEVLYDTSEHPLVPPRIVDLNENPLLNVVTSLCADDRPSDVPAVVDVA